MPPPTKTKAYGTVLVSLFSFGVKMVQGFFEGFWGMCYYKIKAG